MTQFNCLPAGTTIAELVRQEHPIGVDIRYCRNASKDPAETDIRSTQDIAFAEFATVYLMSPYGQATAIHDVQFSPQGVAECAACVAVIMQEIVAWKTEVMAALS